MPKQTMDPGAGTFVLDKTKCDECIHKEVCIYRIERKQPKMKERKAEVFGNIVNIIECEFYRKQ